MSVFIAMPVYRELPAQTALCLLDTQRACLQFNIDLMVQFEVGVSDILLARSICVHRFVQDLARKMFFIDSDMTWSVDSFLRMLALSTKTDAVIGSYPMKREPLDFLSGTPGRVTMNEWGCIPCTAGGLGFSIFDRRVIQTLAAKAPLLDVIGVAIRHPFRHSSENGVLLTEDVTFLRDVRAAGFDLWCDPSIRLGHIGTKVYEGSLYDHTVEKQRESGDGTVDRVRLVAGEEAAPAGQEGVVEARHD